MAVRIGGTKGVLSEVPIGARGTKVDTPREFSLQKLARISNIRGAQMRPEIDAFNAGVMQGV
jgi:hypothetical protein